VEHRLIQHAEDIRGMVVCGVISPAQFRTEVLKLPARDRDAWIDRVFGLDELVDDGPELPRGCVPYMPCALNALLRIADQLPVTSNDVFIDIGSGIGRAAVVMHLLTGASCLGIEVQSGHVKKAHELQRRLGLSQVEFVQGEAIESSSQYSIGTVFFLYCPFSGAKLERFLDELQILATQRPISVCTVDLPLSENVWLEQRFDDGEVRIHRSIKSPQAK
jgi:Methyltransferase domain